jgi:FkbM family methyltransferase
VGSAGWLPRIWTENNNSRKIAHLIRFEPQENNRKSEHIITIDKALWEYKCEKDFFFFSGGGGGASLYEQNFDYVNKHYEELRVRGPRNLAETWFQRSAIHKIEKIDCTTLDNVIASLNLPFEFHFLKIDAQGAEYPIIKGGKSLLQNSLVGLHLELFEIPLYKDIALLPEVKEYLKSMGFDCVFEYPAHGTFASQRDCVFLKKSSQHTPIYFVLKEVYGLP